MDSYISELRLLRRQLTEHRRGIVSKALEGDVSIAQTEAAAEALAKYKALIEAVDAAIFDERREGQMSPNG